jgi:hypothetical protein
MASPSRAWGVAVVYSAEREPGRPIIERFQEATVTVEVRYGDTAEIAATILEEGDNSPADVLPSARMRRGRRPSPRRVSSLRSTPVVLDRVPRGVPIRRRRLGRCVRPCPRAGLQHRVRDRRAAAQRVADLSDPSWSGKVGWAPTNGSFQAFVTAYRVLSGDDVVRDWLTSMQGTGPSPSRATGRSSGPSPPARSRSVSSTLLQVRDLGEEGTDLPVDEPLLRGRRPRLAGQRGRRRGARHRPPTATRPRPSSPICSGRRPRPTSPRRPSSTR